MAPSSKPVVHSIHRRGTSLCVVIPTHIMSQLGWSEQDMVQLVPMNGRLVLVKVAIPTAAELQGVVNG